MLPPGFADTSEVFIAILAASVTIAVALPAFLQLLDFYSHDAQAVARPSLAVRSQAIFSRSRVHTPATSAPARTGAGYPLRGAGSEVIGPPKNELRGHQGVLGNGREAEVCDIQAAIGSEAAECETPGAGEHEQLDALRQLWLAEVQPRLGVELELDPLMGQLSTHELDALLTRFLNAESSLTKGTRDSGAVQRAANRLESTALFRRTYACANFHQQGAARALMMHATNAGASVYFGDCGLRAEGGVPVLMGRVALMTDERAPGRKPSDTMRPAQHLRAALFVIERATYELRKLSQGGMTPKGFYILDVRRQLGSPRDRLDSRVPRLRRCTPCHPTLPSYSNALCVA